MKHLPATFDKLDDEFVCELAEIGVELPWTSREWLLKYLGTVLESNTKLNLTRIVEPRQALRLHLVDSLVAFCELHAAPEGPALDLGSGAGFPGVPLAVADTREFVLLDSVAKKSAAVREILGRLDSPGIRIDSVAARAEEFARDHASQFSAVVARAVAPLPCLVELASPLLKQGGLLIALKGCPESAERESGAAVARLVGMEERSWREIRLPEGAEERTIVVYERTGPSNVRVPRRTGLAQHSPLA